MSVLTERDLPDNFPSTDVVILQDRGALALSHAAAEQTNGLFNFGHPALDRIIFLSEVGDPLRRAFSDGIGIYEALSFAARLDGTPSYTDYAGTKSVLSVISKTVREITDSGEILSGFGASATELRLSRPNAFAILSEIASRHYTGQADLAVCLGGAATMWNMHLRVEELLRAA